MAEEADAVTTGDGWAAAHLDALGDGYGFRKVRRALDVTAFGVNAIVIPPGYAGARHFHDAQEELYFVHAGTLEFEFEDGAHRLSPGGVVRVHPRAVRRMRNVGDVDAVVLVVGGKDGYVGRDAQLAEGETSRVSGPEGAPGA